MISTLLSLLLSPTPPPPLLIDIFCYYVANMVIFLSGICVCVLISTCAVWVTRSEVCFILFCFPDDRSQTILPLVKSFCEKSFKADESILISLSFHLGKLCHGLYGMIYLKNFKIVDSFFLFLLPQPLNFSSPVVKPIL